MLLSYRGASIGQDEIVAAAGAQKSVYQRGMTIEELGLAVNKLCPNLEFWYKYESTITELGLLVNEFKQPVGVEWQGLFDFEYFDEEDETEDVDDDEGHYGLITQVDTQNNKVILVDPDKHYADKDRFFTVLEFERRWWDSNTVVDSVSGRSREVSSYHSMFIIVPRGRSFPENLAMTRLVS